MCKVGICCFNLLIFLICYTSISAQVEKRVEINDLDSLSGVSFAVEKRRLDNVAETWKSTPNKIIVLVVYSDEQSKDKSPAIKRLKKSKKYLIKKYDIPRAKIITKYGGVGYGKMEMRVFIVEEKDLGEDEN